MDITSLIGACAVIAATSGFAPHETKTEQVGERTVVWYEHGTDPAWGASRQFTDKFTVARPVSGDRNGAPLLVQLHGRGGGKPNGGILSLYKTCTDTDSVYACPGDFYVLALDSRGISTLRRTRRTTSSGGEARTSSRDRPRGTFLGSARDSRRAKSECSRRLSG